MKITGALSMYGSVGFRVSRRNHLENNSAVVAQVDQDYPSSIFLDLDLDLSLENHWPVRRCCQKIKLMMPKGHRKRRILQQFWGRAFYWAQLLVFLARHPILVDFSSVWAQFWSLKISQVKSPCLSDVGVQILGTLYVLL